MTFDEFLKNCTACGGNWVAMLLTGVKVTFPGEYDRIVAGVEKVGFGHGGFKAFEYVLTELEKLGVIPPDDK